MDMMVFDGNVLQAAAVDNLEVLLQSSQDVVWIDIAHPDMQALQMLEKYLNFHPLAMEDTYNQHQRPKVEEYEDHLFIIFNRIVKVAGEYEFHELDVFLGHNYIVTVHYNCEALIQEVRERITNKSIFKHPSSEFIFYALVDTIVDGYFPVLTEIDEAVEDLSEQILTHADQKMLAEIFQLRRTLNEIWRVVGAQRDMFNILTRREHDLLVHHDMLEYYLRDVYDHLLRISDTSMLLRENLNNLIDLYVSANANRLNMVVNRLTVITIVIGVLTVISGFYGMNFEHTFPPFGVEWGVPFALGLMLVISSVILLVFKRLKLY